MHGSAGLHSAMAIKRQRRIREQARKRALERERRLSSQTSSMDSLEVHPTKRKRPVVTAPPDHKLATSIGMLHLGICFLVLGIFLIGSGLLPDDMVTWRGGGWWNELVMTGLFILALGIFLISLNRVMSKMEEESLEDYVQTQLTRSKSGHRLQRDPETGCLTTKNHSRMLERKREDMERGLGSSDVLPSVHSPKHTQNGDAHLEQIMEEDVFEKPEDVCIRPDFELLKETVSTTTTASLSPGTPSETRELISNGRHHGRQPNII